ncbi:MULTISPECIES: helix-turn-helix domain-containing protein [Brevundimonas]|uniref:helix-turn-helix domain-containing protein n=1 Tax=Brevundimonas TaxID=41275 RepID=UPI003917B965
MSRSINDVSLTLTIPEACRYMRVSRSTIYNLAKAGKLPIRKIVGRSLILRSDIHRLLGLDQ